MPSPPPSSSSPLDWGEPKFVEEQFKLLSTKYKTKELSFDRGTQYVPAIGPKSYVAWMLGFGNTKAVFEALDPSAASEFKAQLENLFASYFRDNYLIHDFNMARAVKI